MKILTASVNNPAFIEFQYNTIKKYIGSNVPLIIFNDVKNFSDITNFYDSTINKDMINIISNHFNCQCIDISNEQHRTYTDVDRRCADSLNIMTTYMLANPDKYLVIDSDMFFCAPFDVRQFNSYYFAYVEKTTVISGSTVNYPSPNLFYIDTTTIDNPGLINWDLPNLNSTWLASLNPSKIYKFDVLGSLNWAPSQFPDNINSNLKTVFLDKDWRNAAGKYFCEIYNTNILHFRGGSNNLYEQLKHLLPDPNNMNNMLNLHVQLCIILRQAFALM